MTKGRMFALLSILSLLGCGIPPKKEAQSYLEQNKLDWGQPEKVVDRGDVWVFQYPMPPNTLGVRQLIISKKTGEVHVGVSR